MPWTPRGGRALSRAASGRVPGPRTTDSSLNGIMLMIIFITVLTAPPAKDVPADREAPAAPAAKPEAAEPKGPEASETPASPAATPAAIEPKAPEASAKFAAPVARPAPPAKPIATPEEAAAWAARIPQQKRPPPPGEELPQQGADKTENAAVSTVV